MPEDSTSFITMVNGITGITIGPQGWTGIGRSHQCRICGIQTSWHGGTSEYSKHINLCYECAKKECQRKLKIVGQNVLIHKSKQEKYKLNKYRRISERLGA